MTDWQGIADGGYPAPADADLDVLAAELATALAEPDPHVRDGAAYAVLAHWIRAGVLDGQLRWLGDQMADRFTDPRVQARTFAPLVLAWVIERGTFDERWVRAFMDWYPGEIDLRGHDEHLGWLHAVAHGADLLGVLGRHPQVRPDLMLGLATRRMLAPTTFVWRDAEDDRLACALALTLTRADITDTESAAWLEPVEREFAAGEPGPVPPFASNAMRTLRMLYLLADRGVLGEPDGEVLRLTHRAAVLDALARTLAEVCWFLG
ncbi:MAG TPA: DUF2785 domain-containing protein [Streptosporangiaceae bacterium]|jgi:hypothetical protein